MSSAHAGATRRAPFASHAPAAATIHQVAHPAAAIVRCGALDRPDRQRRQEQRPEGVPGGVLHLDPVVRKRGAEDAQQGEHERRPPRQPPPRDQERGDVGGDAEERRQEAQRDLTRPECQQHGALHHQPAVRSALIEPQAAAQLRKGTIAKVERTISSSNHSGAAPNS